MDKSVDLYKLLRGKKSADGVKIVKAVTVDPDPLTFIFEGTNLALDLDIFEIPVNMYPIKKDDRFIVYPVLNSGRWALLQKLNGCTVNLATMQEPSSFIIDGIGKTYAGDDVIVPTGLVTGDRVTVVAVYDNGKVKYAVLNKVT